jgi:hypothetical protein
MIKERAQTHKLVHMSEETEILLNKEETYEAYRRRSTISRNPKGYVEL